MFHGGTWSALHIVLFVVWLAMGLATLVVTHAIKNKQSSFSTRSKRARMSRYLQILPRASFAVMLAIGIELTRIANIYPLDPEMHIGIWVAAVAWLIALALRLCHESGALEKQLGYAEIALAALGGMGFVVYGLNSLATGAPIDDPWFAAKLLLVGAALWTLIAIDLNFRAISWPLEEIALDGSTPENEEGLARGVNHTLTSMVILYVLVIAAAFVGGGMAR